MRLGGGCVHRFRLSPCLILASFALFSGTRASQLQSPRCDFDDDYDVARRLWHSTWATEPVLGTTKRSVARRRLVFFGPLIASGGLLCVASSQPQKFLGFGVRAVAHGPRRAARVAGWGELAPSAAARTVARTRASLPGLRVGLFGFLSGTHTPAPPSPKSTPQPDAPAGEIAGSVTNNTRDRSAPSLGKNRALGLAQIKTLIKSSRNKS